MSNFPHADPARGSTVILDLTDAARRVLLEALTAQDGACQVALEFDPVDPVESLNKGGATLKVKAGMFGTWSPPLANAPARVQPLYDSPREV